MARNVASRLLFNLGNISGCGKIAWFSRGSPCICNVSRRLQSSGNTLDMEDYDIDRERKQGPDRIRFFEHEGDPNKNPFNTSLIPEQVRYEDPSKDLNPEERKIHTDVVSRINSQIAEKTHGRLFAVVHIAGRQYRVTDEDVILILGKYHLAVGEKIKMEKILAVGSKDFTLLGRPILDRGFVNVDATVIEKSLSYPIIKMIHFHRIPRRIRRFDRLAETMVRINRVTFNRQLNEKPDPEAMIYNIR